MQTAEFPNRYDIVVRRQAETVRLHRFKRIFTDVGHAITGTTRAILERITVLIISLPIRSSVRVS